MKKSTGQWLGQWMQWHPVVLWGAVVSALYLLVIFPQCFFRHDDWWILGNSVLHLPKDWGFLWRPTLFHRGHEITWFFRPFFKLFTFLFYEAFGFHYYLWLVTLFAMFAGTLALGHRALSKLLSPYAAAVFVLWFLAAVPLHIGSLAWMGEGMMNIPQALLLMVSTVYFFQFANASRFDWCNRSLWISLASFILCLGFKESTIFHLAFFGAILLAEPVMGFRKNLKPLLLYFAPFAIVGALYLAIRLGWMPLNQGYRPAFAMKLWLLSAGKFLSVPVGATLLWVCLDCGLQPERWKAWGRAVLRRYAYLSYFLVSMSVYLGQDFFSPGWWYLPALFLAMVLAFCQDEVQKVAPQRSMPLTMTAGAVLAVFSLFSAWQLHHLGWWEWGRLQRQMHEFVTHANPGQVRMMTFYRCDARTRPDLTLERVVGDAEALRNQWKLVHKGQSVLVSYRYCDQMETDQRSPTSTAWIKEAVFAWQFPKLIPISERAALQKSP